MRFLELSQIFRAIALGGVALGAAGCSHTLDLSRFDQSLCEGGKYRPVLGFRAALGVDHVSLREKQYGSPEITVLDAEGTECSAAPDVGACTTALAAALAGAEGWSYGNLPTNRFLVTTRGNEVRVYKTLAEVKALLQPIDSAAEAAFLLTQGNDWHRVSCAYGNAHRVPGGYEIVTEVGSTCGGDVERRITLVRADGTASKVDREILEEGDPGCVAGRRPEGFRDRAVHRDVGGYFALLAQLEGAAVVAFARLAAELRLHGAPPALVRAAEAARRDEVRHAKTMRALARRFGASPQPVEVADVAPRDLLAVAVENAAEGCVREAFGAVIGAFAAEHAADPAVGRALRVVAADEARHAALAFAIDAWAASVLDAEGRAAVERARADALENLGTTAVWPDEVRTIAGHPVADEQRILAERFARLVA